MAPSEKTLRRTLERCAAGKWREQIAAACFTHALASGDVSLCLYDVTTLYFEAEKEDDLRKVGFSKERRVDPQIVVGLLVDRHGFPLEIGCFEGNTAETTTLLPIVTAFAQRHEIADLVIVADAGMLSAKNLRELDEAGQHFIVGSRSVKAPLDLASHFRWHGDAFTDGQVIDTLTPKTARTSENDVLVKSEPVWDAQEHPGSWRAVWAYSRKRAVRDNITLTLQENKARAVIAGEKASRTPRFVSVKGSDRSLDEASLARARRLVGLKGYVTNLPATRMSAAEVISSYHDLWNVEQSFRLSKTDLAARPMFVRNRDTIEAHLTLVMTALAVVRETQKRTGLGIKTIVRRLRPLRSATIAINGATFGVMRATPPSTAAYCSSGSGCVTITPTPLARSIDEPPPTATMPSQPSARYIAAASITASSVGFGGVSWKTRTSAAPPIVATTRSRRPAAATPRSVTTRARRMPRRVSSPGSSFSAPKSN